MSQFGIHTGDAHVDDGTHGFKNPETGINRAWESHLAALKSAVDAALEGQVNVFLHNGDAFKNGNPSSHAETAFAETLLPLTQEGIPVVLLDGNHERYGLSTSLHTSTTAVGEMLRGKGKGEVHVVEREPSLIRLKNGLQIVAMPWLSKTTILARLGEPGLDALFGDRLVTDYAIRAMEEMVAECDETAPLILASHVTVDDVRIDSITEGHRRGSEMDLAHLFAEPIIPRKALEDLPFSYVALSHIHARQRIGTKCFYAGSPDRLTMTDADDEKSVNLFEIGDSNTLESVKYIPTNARPMHSIDLVDRDAEDRLEALEPGALVRLMLAPGDAAAPEVIRDLVAERKAIIVESVPVPVDRPRTEVVKLPEKITPVKALTEWATAKKIEGVDMDYLMNMANELAEESAK